MQVIEDKDILDLVEYEKIRDEVRPRIIATKRSLIKGALSAWPADDLAAVGLHRRPGITVTIKPKAV